MLAWEVEDVASVSETGPEGLKGQEGARTEGT